MIKQPRWNTDDFVFEDDPIIVPRPREKEPSSLGLFLRLMLTIPLAMIFLAIFCVGLATIFSYMVAR
jgi:hypothetical protein